MVERSFESADESNALFTHQDEGQEQSFKSFKKVKQTVAKLLKKKNEMSCLEFGKVVPLSMLMVHAKEEITSDPIFEWINKDKLIVTINNNYYYINMRASNTSLIRNRFNYGIQ